MFLAKVSINRPVMTTMGILVFIIFGLLAYFSLSLNLAPDVEIPWVTVTTIYPGAGPKEIETLISKPIEDAVATVSLIERVESYSLDGISVVIIEFKLQKNVDVANQEVKDKVDAIINVLPTDAERPIVQKVDIRSFPVVDVVLSGDLDPRELFTIADRQLKDRFSQIEGVAQVNIVGGQEREIRVIMDDRIVYEQNISLPQLLQVLRANNMDIPGGYFSLRDQEYTVRLSGEYSDLETIEEMSVSTPFGPRKIRQFAQVVDSGKDIRMRAIYFNKEKDIRDENVVRLGIVKSAEGNTVEVAQSVRAALPGILATLPEGVTLEVVNDESNFVQSSLNDTMSNVLLGVLFTSLVLLVFLHDIRSTLIVALSMPTSIISTFLLLQVFGLSLNMMTLMGLSVSVGVLVANSVVVLENIFRYKNLGKKNKESAYFGTSEVTVAILAATLTNIVVFLPIANMSSMVGLWLRELALAAVFATIFSLIMSFTLTPMLASILLPDKPKKGRIGKWFDGFESRNTAIYKWLLMRVLINKKMSTLVVLSAFVLFIVTMVGVGPQIGVDFMPALDDGKIRIEVELPEGYNLNESARVLAEIEERIKAYPEVVHILTDLGRLSFLDIGPNMGMMTVQLVDRGDRDIGVERMINLFVEDLATVPNARIKVFNATESGGPGAPVQFYVLGYELETLEELKDEITVLIQDVPGLINLDNSSRAGKPELTVYPRRDRLTEAGLTTMDLALTLRASIEGMVSSQYRELGYEYDITVTLSNESADTPEKIGNIPIVSPVSGAMRLSQVADVEFTTGFTKILHRDKYVTISFTGSPAAGVPLGDVTNEIDRRLETLDLPPGYRIAWGGNVQMMNEMVQDMIFAFFLAVILTYMLLAAILESFWQPVLIMITVLLAMIGVILSLYITDTTFSITSLMAIVMLIGIVVNNAILMLDFTNQLRRQEGRLPKEALLTACPIKLKPILMSTTAIILGMLPLALGIGDAGMEWRVPLGVVAIGGLLVSTVLTLFVIPAFYYLTAREKSVVIEKLTT
jgi:hydrophobic/amphiphilic exporter-1 (mainly G- bacteria), HAE1 family